LDFGESVQGDVRVTAGAPPKVEPFEMNLKAVSWPTMIAIEQQQYRSRQILYHPKTEDWGSEVRSRFDGYTGDIQGQRKYEHGLFGQW